MKLNIQNQHRTLTKSISHPIQKTKSATKFQKKQKKPMSALKLKAQEQQNNLK